VSRRRPAPSPGRPAAIAWADFQPRTLALASAFGGQAVFVSTRLRHPALLPVRCLASAVRTWRLLEERRPELVLVSTPPVVAPLVAWLWCRLRGRPLVVDCHTDTFHARGWRWALPVHRWLLRRSRAALVRTEESGRIVEGWGALGVLLPDDLPQPAEAEPAAPLRRTTVLVAGSLDASEAVAETLAMAALMPEVEVRVTGDAGRVPAGLREAAPANVVFTGFLPYRLFLGEMLAAQVVAVFSTDPHVVSRSAFEAVGLGRPLVLSDLEGLRGWFGAAALFAANHPEAMAASLRAALDDQAGLAARTRSLARELGRQRQRALARLRRLLNGSARPAAPRRVLRVTGRSPGDSIVRRDLAELLEQGVEVDVVCVPGRPGPDVAGLGPRPGLRVYRVPVRPGRPPVLRHPLQHLLFFAAALALVTWLGLRRRYATVQVDNPPDLLVGAALVPRWRGARLVLNMHELVPEMVATRFGGRLGRALVRASRWSERAAIRRADHVIVVTRPCLEALRARGVPAGRVSVVPNTTSQAAEAAPRTADGAPPVLVTHTTLVGPCGVHVVIRGLALLAPDWPGLTLRVIGGGEQPAPLARQVEALGLTDRVVFTGDRPGVEALDEVRRATVGIVAIPPDGYGQLLLPAELLEYTRLGVPAVCSRLPAVQAYFPHDTLAYFQPGDERELAAQVARILRDPDLARRQARRAEEAARALAWDRVRLDYLAALGVGDQGPAW
jgi:glycosyltransferase involved in cell wall biosynthesis